jgi:hypothetical protein
MADHPARGFLVQGLHQAVRGTLEPDPQIPIRAAALSDEISRISANSAVPHRGRVNSGVK